MQLVFRVVLERVFTIMKPSLDSVCIPKRVVTPVLAWIHIEYFFEDLEIVWNLEFVSRVFVAEKIVEIIKSAPGDC